jgi:hypothetical protein
MRAPMLTSALTPLEPLVFISTLRQLPVCGVQFSVCVPEPRVLALQKDCAVGGEEVPRPSRW